jgi:hypothetical protein
MKSRFILFRRAGAFYSEDTTTRKQISLRTKDDAEALALLHSKNEAHRQPVLNLQIARTYLTATDPKWRTGLGRPPMHILQNPQELWFDIYTDETLQPGRFAAKQCRFRVAFPPRKQRAWP